jgi:type VI secretion system protein ImpA
MKFSDLLSPAASEPPCGPDLDLAGDNDYFNYTIPAESRLPERFIEPDTGKIFDRNSIDLEQESASIRALLERSRDIRLFVLQGQFCALAGDFAGLVDCMSVIEGLLSQYWNDVHPVAADGDLTARKAALDGLADRVKIIAPLTYLPIVKDRSAGAISWRLQQVAARPELARPSEKRMDAALLRSAFSEPLNRPEIEAFYDLATTCLGHLKSINLQFLINDAGDFTPATEGVSGLLGDIVSFIGGFIERGVANAASNDAGAAAESSGWTGAPQAGVSAPESVAAAGGPITAVPVGSQAEAKAALSAVEAYFTQCEPSSPALLLVHQARLLIGAPIVEALAALAPGRVESARLVIDKASGFALDMPKMRQLSAPVTKGEGEERDGPSAELVVIRTRRQALGLMLGVERFLADTEPSSPVPLLLARAREFMDKSFASIIVEMFSQPDPKK